MPIMNDFKYAGRVLASDRWLTLMIVALLSIGIGASAVMFSAFDALLLKPLPVAHPEQLVRLVEKVPQAGTRSDFHYGLYEALTRSSTSLAAVFAETQFAVAMNEPVPAEVVRVGLTSPEFFNTLGVPALYGRSLSPADADPGSTDLPAVLSYSFWNRRFNADPNALGRTIRLHQSRFAIVGVMPVTFNGIAVESSPDIRVPVRAYSLLADAGAQPMQKFGQFEMGARLKPPASYASAQSETLAIWRQTTQDYWRNTWNLPLDLVNVYLSRGMELEPLNHGVSMLRERFGDALELLLGAAGLLLMLISVNAAGLVLARNARRDHEMAVRLAIGATRWQVLRQLLVENVLLTLTGTIGGLIITKIGGPMLVRALPPMRDPSTSKLTLTIQLGVDWRVLLFVICASAGAVLLSGLSPALIASRTNIDRILRSSRATGALRCRKFAVATQVALCTVLLSGSGLLVRTLYELRSTNSGFNRDHIVTATINPGLAGYTGSQASVFREKVLQQARALPGVQGAAAALIAVMRGSGIKSAVSPAGKSGPGELNASLNPASADYFDVMGLRILSGRGLTKSDGGTRTPIPVVVNETFARRFFPDQSAVGKFFGNVSAGVAPAQYEIVGVVTDAKYRSIREQIPPTYYPPLNEAGGFFQLVVRSQLRPDSLLEPIRREVATIDPTVPISEIHTLSEEVDSSIAGERLTALLALMFGLVAAALSGIGLYGLLSNLVQHREQEIGIRMALGAGPGRIATLIGGEAFVLVATGVLLGLPIALVARSAVRSLLYGVGPSDVTSLASSVLFTVAVSLLAIAGPVISSLRIQPSLCLKRERSAV
jgi:predicted permease